MGFFPAKSIKSKVTKWKQTYPSIENIEEKYGIHYDSTSDSSIVADQSNDLASQFKRMQMSDQVTFIDSMFSHVASSQALFDIEHFVPKCLEAMQTLKQNGKKNLVDKFCEAIACKRANGDSLMPLHRMPFGLIEFNINTFTSTHPLKVI